MFFQLLYDAVAVGMWGYTRSVFRVETIGGEGLHLQPGTIIVSTHRADTDVPVICPSLYARARLWRRRAVRPHFAAREDVFERSFFACAPSRLPLVARRVLFPLSIGPILTRLPMHPVAHPSVNEIRLGQALRQLQPDTPLDGVLPHGVATALRARSRDHGPRTAAEAVTSAYADVLWRVVRRDELSHPVFDDIWRRRTAVAAGDLRRLVEIVRTGKALFLFPEGRPSPDGAVGPLRGGLSALVRRGLPSVILPLGVAYDPLTRGRPRAFVAFGEPVSTAANTDDDILAALRRATPLTCGQVVADALLDSGAPVNRVELATALDHAVSLASAEGRPVERDLLDPARRDRRLRGCLAALDRRGDGKRGSDPLLRRLAREFASAREGAAASV